VSFQNLDFILLSIFKYIKDIIVIINMPGQVKLLGRVRKKERDMKITGKITGIYMNEELEGKPARVKLENSDYIGFWEKELLKPFHAGNMVEIEYKPTNSKGGKEYLTGMSIKLHNGKVNTEPSKDEVKKELKEMAIKNNIMAQVIQKLTDAL
jgi:hypothetical protein